MSVWIDQLRRLAECVDRQEAELRHTADDRLSLRALSRDTDTEAALDQFRTEVSRRLMSVTGEHRTLLTDPVSARLTALIADADQCVNNVREQARVLELRLSSQGYQSHAELLAAQQKSVDATNTDEQVEVLPPTELIHNTENLLPSSCTLGFDSDANDEGDTQKISDILNIRALTSIIVADHSDQPENGSPLAASSWLGGGINGNANSPDMSVQVTPGVTRGHCSRSASLGIATSSKLQPPTPLSITKSAVAGARSVVTSAPGDDVTRHDHVVSDYAEQLLRQLEQRSAMATASSGCYSARKTRASRADDTPPMPELSEYTRRLLNL